MTIITLSRQVSCNAEEVAARLCADLGLAAFGKGLMVQVASELGFGENEIVDYSEDRYKVRNVLDALFRRSRPVAEVTSWMEGPTQAYEPLVDALDDAIPVGEVRTPQSGSGSRWTWSMKSLDEEKAISLIRAAINAAYERGEVLIMGRGGQVVLEDKPNVLHVRLVAPFESRLATLQAETKLTAAAARRHIVQRDRATAEYLSTFYGVDVDDSTLYHLILNTAKTGVDGAIALIKAALPGPVQEQTGVTSG